MMPAPLQIMPSRRAKSLQRWLVLAAVLTALSLPFWWCLFATGLLVIQCYLLRIQSAAPMQLQILPDGRLQVGWQDGSQRLVQILPSSVITAQCMLLRLCDEHGQFTLVLWPDSAEATLLKQWRRWLLWEMPALQRRVGRQAHTGVD